MRVTRKIEEMAGAGKHEAVKTFMFLHSSVQFGNLVGKLLDEPRRVGAGGNGPQKCRWTG